MEKTLLLNATYEPINVISWQRAAHLYFLGKVEIVESYDRQIGTPNLSMNVPAVVRVKKFIPAKKYRHVRFSRHTVFTRDRHACRYCGRTYAPEQLTFDHVVPQSLGGQKNFENIVAACRPCNYKKADKTPDEAGMPLIGKIHSPVWPLAATILSSTRRNIPEMWKDYLFAAQ